MPVISQVSCLDGLSFWDKRIRFALKGWRTSSRLQPAKIFDLSEGYMFTFWAEHSTWQNRTGHVVIFETIAVPVGASVQDFIVAANQIVDLIWRATCTAEEQYPNSVPCVVHPRKVSSEFEFTTNSLETAAFNNHRLVPASECLSPDPEAHSDLVYDYLECMFETMRAMDTRGIGASLMERFDYFWVEPRLHHDRQDRKWGQRTAVSLNSKDGKQIVAKYKFQVANPMEGAANAALSTFREELIGIFDVCSPGNLPDGVKTFTQHHAEYLVGMLAKSIHSHLTGGDLDEDRLKAALEYEYGSWLDSVAYHPVLKTFYGDKVTSIEFFETVVEEVKLRPVSASDASKY